MLFELSFGLLLRFNDFVLVLNIELLKAVHFMLQHILLFFKFDLLVKTRQLPNYNGFDVLETVDEAGLALL